MYIPNKFLISLILLFCVQFTFANNADFLKAQEKAQQGDAEAQGLVGVFFLKGQGVKKDETEAFKWFMKAANQNNSNAQALIGYMYFEGRGIKKDETEALKWLMKAANQNHSDAQGFIGAMYAEGIGVEKNLATAFKWYRKAADQNLPEAEYQVGLAYLRGEGVQQSNTTAYDWILRSAQAGYDPAIDEMGHMHLRGIGVERDILKALAWYTKLQKYQSTHNRPSASHAIDFMTKLAQGGDPYYQYWLGNLNYYGIRSYPRDIFNERIDYKEALHWLKKSADQNFGSSQELLADMYLYGKGTDKDKKLALKWFEKAASNGNVDAQIELAQKYYSGFPNFLEENKELSYKYYLAAANQGSSHALDMVKGSWIHHGVSEKIQSAYRKAQPDNGARINQRLKKE